MAANRRAQVHLEVKLSRQLLLTAVTSVTQVMYVSITSGSNRPGRSFRSEKLIKQHAICSQLVYIFYSKTSYSLISVQLESYWNRRGERIFVVHSETIYYLRLLEKM
ncbi:uncharacterized protein LOC144209519 [Stigmatopora nigra]